MKTMVALAILLAAACLAFALSVAHNLAEVQIKRVEVVTEIER